MLKVMKIKNKAPDQLQITVEQSLQEADEQDLKFCPSPPKQNISDPYKLAYYQRRERKKFEDNICKNRMAVSNWITYAQWEENQNQLQRARLIYERALDVDCSDITLWLRYAEMEMRNQQMNHARNLWERAVAILPRANQLWYEYTNMEERLENYSGARQIFERWMMWKPDEQAWQTYINFELRHKEIESVRKIYESFVMVHPEVRNWIQYAHFEESHGCINNVHEVYERAVEFYGDEYLDEELLIAFIKFEKSQGKHEKAGAIYKYALDHISHHRIEEIYKAYTVREMKYGDRSGMEDAIADEEQHEFEQEVKDNPLNYEAWIDYLKLVESGDNLEVIRETYERAITNIPSIAEKQFWRRYIYLWINYALFEEFKAKDIERCRQVYKKCLVVIPHKQFTFSKIWLFYAHFEVRQNNLTAARKALDMALGTCPTDKLYRGYIDLETRLWEFGKCRILCEKFLEFGPTNCNTWMDMKYEELEILLGEIEE